MDCRLVVAMSLNLLWLAGGCVGWQTQPAAPAGSAVAGSEPHTSNFGPRESRQGKRLPQAGTVVAAAAWKESEATRATTPAAQRALLDESRKIYQEALQIDAACLQAYVGLGRVYTTLGDYDRALSTYANGLAKHPRDIALWLGQGKCLARRKHFDRAAQSFSRAVEIDPENRDALKQLGFCLARAGRVEEGFPYLVQALGKANAHWAMARMIAHLAEEGMVAPEAAREGCCRHLRLALHANPQLSGAHEMLRQMTLAHRQPAGANQGAGNRR